MFFSSLYLFLSSQNYHLLSYRAANEPWKKPIRYWCGWPIKFFTKNTQKLREGLEWVPVSLQATNENSTAATERHDC